MSMWMENTGERYAPVCIDERLPLGCGSIVVWAEISSQARRKVVFIESGSLVAQKYIMEVLENL